ncbi:MAG: alpha/beta fold hydrolase [Winogradskyella sp.]|uniref:alpha/beta fold hydrolase n=1 Tax=Winogradskyella sp. TaxID=1883156 RepID=UPI000F3F5CC5|nr:alpha/beta fold hydrolase [Winogradskyella sp.]RNC86943.1 MAG: alpha/beta fold hydrolase [Winogradskyella sp.]
MKVKLFHILITLGLLSSYACYGQKQNNFKPNFKVSTTTTHKIAEDQDYTFGYMEVLENRDHPDSKTIKFPVYIFKSRNPNPDPDPIIYTVGGPGYTTMPSAQYMKYYRYLDNRDFILVEQRGNYYAEPHLDCPEWGDAITKSNSFGFDDEQTDQLFDNAARKCKNRLTKKNIDLNGYNTNEIAADINDLVNVLGIEQYNLLTISYSTKIAQVLLRDYPKRIRSVVMDSPLPLEVSYDEESITNLIEVAEKVLDDCSEDTECDRAFPDLKNRFFNFLREKTENPLSINIQNPENGEMETFHFKGADLIQIFSLYSTGNVPNLPLEVDKILNGDLSTIISYQTSLFSQKGDGSGKGMRLSVWCSEEYPFNSKEKIEMEANRYPEVIGLNPAVFKSSVCEIWGVNPVSKKENEAIKSNVPILLISGEYDESTPLKWAKNMLPNLENAYHIIFKGWKHIPTTYWNNPCGMEVANSFFENPNAAPQPKCLERIKTPKFNTKK